MTAEPGCCPSALQLRCIDRLFTPAMLPGAGWVATQPLRSRCLRGLTTAQVSKHLAAGQGLSKVWGGRFHPAFSMPRHAAPLSCVCGR